MKHEQNEPDEFDCIVNLKDSLLKRKLYTFDYKKKSQNEVSEDSLSDEFYNPLADIKLESKRSGQSGKLATCPACFQFLTHKSTAVKCNSRSSGCSLYELTDPVNVEVDASLMIDHGYGVIDEKNSEINMVLKCKGCANEIGFFNFNENRYFLVRHII